MTLEDRNIVLALRSCTKGCKDCPYLDDDDKCNRVTEMAADLIVRMQKQIPQFTTEEEEALRAESHCMAKGTDCSGCPYEKAGNCARDIRTTKSAIDKVLEAAAHGE